RLRREVLVWSQLDHPNILQLLGIAYGFGPPGTYGMVSPWIDNGNLSYYLDQHRIIPISNRISMLLLRIQGATNCKRPTLSYVIHQFIPKPLLIDIIVSNSVVHSDLTGNNVLVEKDGHMLLGDFGLSSIKEDYSNGLYDTSSTPKYNLPWTAPEIVLSEAFPRPNQTTDIYSFGSVTLQVLTGVRPYQGMSEGVICRVLEKRGFPDRPKCGMVHDDFWELMLKCWSRNSEERPGIADI
ncbi:kinase-like domain-containing protein, partial [Collybia nuda]